MKAQNNISLLPTALVFIGAALLSAPGALAQNIFVANWYSPGAIYQFTPGGGQSTFYSGGLGEPLGMVFNNSGNLLVADSLDNKIDEFIGGTETSIASVNHPVWLAYSSSGILFASSADGSIYEISSGGSVSAFTSGLSAPTDMAFDKSGDLFINNWGVGDIDEYKNIGGTLSSTATIFATGLVGGNGLAFNAAGDLFSAENTTGTGDILEFTPQGNESEFASGLGGAGELAFDSSGNLFMTDGETLLKITSTGSASTFAQNLGNSTGIVIQNLALPVPEPPAYALLALSATTLLVRIRLAKPSRAARGSPQDEKASRNQE